MKSALYLFLFGYCFSIRAQSTSADVLAKVYEAVNACNPCQYDTRMYFRTFGEDSFEIRDFTIRFRSNPDNPAYGHDWEITEYHPGGYTSTMMHAGTEFYMIYTGSDQKLIHHIHQSTPFETGTYQCTMHEYFYLGSIVSPFKNIPEMDISAKDSNEYQILSCRTSPFSTRELIVSEENPLPIQSITISQSTNFKFEQVQIVNFEFSTPRATLPDSAFNPDFYFHAGYQYQFSDPGMEEEDIPSYKMSEINKVKLLEYPFIDADGDTFLLKNEIESYALLDFWFITCAPCLEAMPGLNDLQTKYASQGLKIFGLNCMNIKSRKNVTKQMQDGKITFPLWYGQNTLLRELGITMFPTYILIHPSGELEYLDGGLQEIKMRLKSIFKKQ